MRLGVASVRSVVFVAGVCILSVGCGDGGSNGTDTGGGGGRIGASGSAGMRGGAGAVRGGGSGAGGISSGGRAGSGVGGTSTSGTAGVVVAGGSGGTGETGGIGTGGQDVPDTGGVQGAGGNAGEGGTLAIDTGGAGTSGVGGANTGGLDVGGTGGLSTGGSTSEGGGGAGTGDTGGQTNTGGVSVGGSAGTGGEVTGGEDGGSGGAAAAAGTAGLSGAGGTTSTGGTPPTCPASGPSAVVIGSQDSLVDLPVATTAGPNSETTPSVAWGSTTALIVWEDNRNGTRDIYGARVCLADGTVLDPNGILIASALGYTLSVAYDNGGMNYLVGWPQYGVSVVHAMRVGESDGTLIDGLPQSGGITVAANAEYGLQEVVTGHAAGNYLVAWAGMCTPLGLAGTCTSTGTTTGGGWMELLTQRVQASDGALLDTSAAIGGRVVGSPHLVASPSMSGGSNSSLLAWWSSPMWAAFTMSAARIDAGTGLVVGTVALQTYATPTGYYPPTTSIGFDGTQFLVATPGCPGAGFGYCTSPSIFGQRVRESDTALLDAGQGFVISSTGGNRTSTAYDGTNFLVAWPDSRGGTYLARIRPSDGALLDGTTAAAGYQVATTGGAIIAAGPGGRALVVESRLATDLGVNSTRIVAKLITTE